MQNFVDYTRNLNRVHLLRLIDEYSLDARKARARASLVVNPLSLRPYGMSAPSGTRADD